MAASGANVLANRARCLGRLRPLRHLPPAAGAKRLLQLQRAAAIGVFWCRVRPGPLAMLTGPSMSPAFTGRFSWYPKLPGNRQIGRSLHFLIMCSFLAFIFMPGSMVALTGFVRNMNHMVFGTDDANPAGLYVGLLGIGVIVALNVWANWMAW